MALIPYATTNDAEELERIRLVSGIIDNYLNQYHSLFRHTKTYDVTFYDGLGYLPQAATQITTIMDGNTALDIANFEYTDFSDQDTNRSRCIENLKATKRKRLLRIKGLFGWGDILETIFSPNFTSTFTSAKVLNKQYELGTLLITGDWIYHATELDGDNTDFTSIARHNGDNLSGIAQVYRMPLDLSAVSKKVAEKLFTTTDVSEYLLPNDNTENILGILGVKELLEPYHARLLR